MEERVKYCVNNKVCSFSENSVPSMWCYVTLIIKVVTPSEFEVLQKESLEFQNSDRDAIKEWRTQKR